MADDNRKSKIELEVSAKGAKEAARDLGRIGDFTGDLRKDFKGLTNEAETLADTIRKDIGGALDEAARSANNLDIKSGSSGGGGGAPAAAKFRGAASLIGGQGAGEIVGVVDDIQDAVEGIGQMGGALTALIPGLAGGAAGAAAMLLPLLPFALAAVAVGVAVKGAIDEIDKRLNKLGAELDAERSAVEAAFAGTTVSEATAQVEKFNQSIEAQTRLLEDNTTRADDAFEALQKREEKVFGPLGDFAARVAVATGKTDVTKYAEQMDKSNEAMRTAEAGSKEWTEEILRGSFKADELTQKETALADARDTTSTATATAAAAEKERAREAEKAAREQERAQAEAQRQQEQAQREVEQQAEKAAAAQDNYNKSIASATTNFKNAVADIGTKRSQGETDIRINQGRDLDDIELKNNRDVTKLIADDWRNARDEAFKNIEEIDDIRREGYKSEREAQSEGDFKQLYLARIATQERLQEENRADTREEQMRKLHLSDARDDLKQSLREESSIRRTAAQRSFDDLKLSTQRELEVAATANQRAQALAAGARNSDLAGLAGHLQRLSGMYQQHFAGVEKMAGGAMRPGTSASAGSKFNASQTIPQTYLGQVISR